MRRSACLFKAPSLQIIHRDGNSIASYKSPDNDTIMFTYLPPNETRLTINSNKLHKYEIYFQPFPPVGPVPQVRSKECTITVQFRACPRGNRNASQLLSARCMRGAHVTVGAAVEARRCLLAVPFPFRRGRHGRVSHIPFLLVGIPSGNSRKPVVL